MKMTNIFEAKEYTFFPAAIHHFLGMFFSPLVMWSFFGCLQDICLKSIEIMTLGGFDIWDFQRLNRICSCFSHVYIYIIYD